MTVFLGLLGLVALTVMQSDQDATDQNVISILPTKPPNISPLTSTNAWTNSDCHTDADDWFRDIVDTDAYPIDNLDSPKGQALISRLQANWTVQGTANLPGFIRSDVIAVLASEVSSLHAYQRKYTISAFEQNTAYGHTGCQETHPDPNHPLNRRFSTNVKVVAGDQVFKIVCKI